MAKSRKPFSLQLKRPKFCNIDWVPKLIQKIFSTMEQKLVQRCETEIIVNACNASYANIISKTLKEEEPSRNPIMVQIFIVSSAVQ